MQVNEQLEAIIDALNRPLMAAYILIGILLILSALGVIGRASREGRIGAGFLAAILLPAGLTFIFDDERFTIVTLIVRICAAWGVLIWWVLTRGRHEH